MEEKLRECFDEMVVYKDLKKSNFFASLSLPSFLRDWLLKRFEDEDGKSAEELFAAAYLDNYYFEDDLDPGDVAKYTDADGTFNLYRYGECLLRLSFDLVHDAQNGCYHVLQAY